MMDMSKSTQIGVIMTLMGLAFILIGIMCLFDRGLLAIGNIFFLSGITFIIGLMRVFSFFFQRHKLKGSLAFFTGIFVLLAGHPIIGVVFELIGFYLLFSGFLPTALMYLASYVPFFNIFSTVRSRSIV